MDICFHLTLSHAQSKVLQIVCNLIMLKTQFARYVKVVILLLMINQLVLTKMVLMEFQTVINI